MKVFKHYSDTFLETIAEFYDSLPLACFCLLIMYSVV